MTRPRESLGNPRTCEPGELNDRATRKARVRDVQIRASRASSVGKSIAR